MGFLIYDYADYKKVLKDRLKERRQTKAKFTLQYLSEALDIQYTFLSKVMNSETHQLSEDQIFTSGYALEFLDDEVEYLMLLRSHQATTNKLRKNFLFKKIMTLQRQKSMSQNTAPAPTSNFGDDVRYLMDYQAMVVHAALSISSLQKNPQALGPLLGLDQFRIKDILMLLDRLGNVEYDSKRHEVKKVLHPRLHFGKSHPLMRTHQLVMKTALNQLSFTKSEEQKENLFVTFTADAASFEKIKSQIKNFTAEVQKVTMDGKHVNVYQMNLDFVELFRT